ncbi:MAG: RNA polymerase sigma factor [Solirubrobacteraceae bacterium]
MEVSALKTPAVARLPGRSPLLRLQPDERLVAMVRKGSSGAFETLVARYQARLLSFCRHMLNSREDAEDVLQEVFASAYNAMIADERPINVRPWLYRIARNRCLNHLRRQQPIGVDSMDVHFADAGMSTADQVHRREEFRQLVADVQTLPETQRTALLLREIDALTYDQIAEAMETTVPSVKSLLVRARVSLAEAAEARLLTCDEVRAELGEVAEGLVKMSPPVRRHLRSCDRCSAFHKQLKQTNKALAAIFPVAPLLLMKKFILTQFGASASAGGSAAAGGAAAAGGGAAASGAAAAGAGASALSAGLTTVATKAAAGLAAAAIVTAGAVEANHVVNEAPAPAPVAVASVPPAPAPTGGVQARRKAAVPAPPADAATPAPAAVATTTTTAPAPAPAPAPVATTPAPAPAPAPTKSQTIVDTTTLPPAETVEPVVTAPASPGVAVPGEDAPSADTPPAAPPAGEGGTPPSEGTPPPVSTPPVDPAPLPHADSSVDAPAPDAAP